MKTMISFAAILSTFSVMATEFPTTCFVENKLDECQDTEFTKACRVPDADAGFLMSEMMLENFTAVAHINAQAKIGFVLNCYDVILVSDKKISRRESEVIMKYDIKLDDCKGTDACMGSSRWTVMQKTISDGYSYSNTYKDKLIKLQ